MRGTILSGITFLSGCILTIMGFISDDGMIINRGFIIMVLGSTGLKTGA